MRYPTRRAGTPVRSDVRCRIDPVRPTGRRPGRCGWTLPTPVALLYRLTPIVIQLIHGIEANDVVSGDAGRYYAPLEV